jgi:hypothetical protein
MAAGASAAVARAGAESPIREAHAMLMLTVASSRFVLLMWTFSGDETPLRA